MSKILIIGAASGLGASLSASLLQNTQHTLTTVDDLRVEKDLKNLQFALSHKKGDRHKFYLTAINDQHIADKLFELERPDWVIFCKTPESVSYHQSLVKAIVCAKKYSAKLLYVSPDSWSYERNESYLFGREICCSDSNCENVSILNVSRIYGPRQEVGDIMVKAMSRIIHNKWPNVSDASGRPKDWIYIKDVVSAIECIIDNGEIGRHYTACSGHVASEHDVMMCLQKISEGRPYDFTNYDQLAMDCSGMLSLGWQPRHRMKDALEHTLSWYSVNTWAIDLEST